MSQSNLSQQIRAPTINCLRSSCQGFLYGRIVEIGEQNPPLPRILQLLFMYLATLLALLTLSASLNCPLADSLRSNAFSGLLSAEPEANALAQDMSYTYNYESQLAQIPEVVLSICGYEDQNAGSMQIEISNEQVTTQSFDIRIRSGQASKWNKIFLNYLVSTKPEIQMTTLTVNRPVYDLNGCITLIYNPRLIISPTTKIRPFIVALDMVANPSGALAINHEKTEINSNLISIIFSSRSCIINNLAVSVVIFDTLTPGVLYVDGSVEQNSLSTTTEVKVEKTSIEELRIHFVGFSSIFARDRSGIKVGVSFSTTFSLMIDSTAINSIKVTYLVVSFVECGSCSGYPYPYDDTCNSQCPRGTILKYGRCVPINCDHGYELNSNNQCVPSCGANQYFSGKSCCCNQGYNMIDGQCTQCPAGTYYNYVQLRCDSLCGDNAQYNSADGRCYCLPGFFVINGRCSQCVSGTVFNPQSQACQCPSGTRFDSNQQACIPVIVCRPNEVLLGNQCVCAQNYYRINGLCSQCPAYSTYNPLKSTCECQQGYILSSGVCIRSCNINQVLQNNVCQCIQGFVRNSQGVCTRIVCRPNEYLLNNACVCLDGWYRNQQNECIRCSDGEIFVNGRCDCRQGLTRLNDNKCYNTTCPQGFAFNFNTKVCAPVCTNGTQWSAQYSRCIEVCSPGFIFDLAFNRCIPLCKSDQKYNGTHCVCAINCQPVCPPGFYYNDTIRQCQGLCANYQVWNGVACVCQPGYTLSNGQCIVVCQGNKQFVNGRCQCPVQFVENSQGQCVCRDDRVWDGASCRCPNRGNQVNGQCVSACPGNRIFVNGRCQCPPGTYEDRGICSTRPTCPTNEQFINGICQCINNFYRINGVCSICPANTLWNPTLNQCISNQCISPRIWNGFTCVCPDGSANQWGSCAPVTCPQNEYLVNGRCECIEGCNRNNQGRCVSQCNNGYTWKNGRCEPINNTTNCGVGEQWSGFNCVCRNNFERISQGYCVQRCGANEQRGWNGQCECISGCFRNPSGVCVPQIACPPPHQLSNNVCVCAAGYEKNNQGQCVTRCLDGYIRNSQGICVLNCRSDQILAEGRCVCRVGLFNINGQCQKCPQFSYQSNGQCICLANNYPVSGGATCPMPNANCDANSQWNPATQSCKCRSPFVWSYGACRIPPTCQPDEDWSGQTCVCKFGFRRVNGRCERASQNPICPENSRFNGINCQCNSGFYPIGNLQCQRCPSNQFWNGRECASSQTCQPGLIWDSNAGCCAQTNRCQANEYWDGASCRCSQGFFYIDGRCSQCPAGTVFDGVKCTRGGDNRCRDPYSYFNGFSCVCIPGFWPLTDGCVTCPQNYEWSGNCCLPKTGLTRSVAFSDQMYPTAVPFRLA